MFRTSALRRRISIPFTLTALFACQPDATSPLRDGESPSPHGPVASTSAVDGMVLVGAGDISSCSTDRDELTAQILDTIPGTVFTAGDNAYSDGTAAEFAGCYDPTWGRHRSRTRPSPGNHDYNTLGAGPYYAYFGTLAGDSGKGYYSYGLGEWHIVSLNTEISMSAGSPQEQWLRADLAANDKQCVLAYWHKPRFSSGPHGSTTSTGPLMQALYDAGAEIVVAGHDHIYERFAPQTPDGVLDTERGIRQFVVGTGGAGSYVISVPLPNSEARSDQAHGVLKLTLYPGSYEWQFIPIAGITYTDVGAGTCHGVSPGPGSAPLVTITAPGNGSTALQGDRVTFSGTATDVQDGDLTANLAWTSSRDGSIGAGGSFATSTLSAGIHTITAAVSDRDGLRGAAVIAVTVVVAGPATVDVRVASSPDDAEQRASGSMYLNSSDLELVDDGGIQTVGLRFVGVAIPPGASISNAYVQFQVDEASSGTTSLTIAGEAADNAGPFTSTAGNVSSRRRTNAAVPWVPLAWPTVGQAGTAQRTPDLTAVLGEIVGRSGWVSGNSVVLITTGSGKRVAKAYDGAPTAAPVLHVEYSISAPSTPTVDAGRSTVTTDVSQAPADGASGAVITVTLLDNAGAPVAGHDVSLAQTGHSILSGPSGASGADGRVSFTITNTTAETVTYTATDVTDAVTISQTAVVTFVALPTDAVTSRVAASASSVPANGTSSAAIVVTLLNRLSVPVVGHSVSLAQTGTSVLSGPSGTSDAGGHVSFTVTHTTAETVTYTATDITDGVTIGQTAAVTFTTVVSPTVINVRVGAKSDDAEQRASGSMYLNSSDLELVDDGGIQTVGLRFVGVAIPPGASISNAYVQFQVDEASSGTTSLTIAGEAVDNAVPFTSARSNLSSRRRTSAAVPWVPLAWPTVGQAGTAQRTPDLTAVLGEIVGRSGWVSGNSVVLIITGSGKRVAKAYDGAPTAAPVLHVEYTR